MKKTDLRGRAFVVPVAVVAGLGMAGMGLVSGGVARAATTDVRSSTDALDVTVRLSCTFNSVEDKAYTGSANNGAEVSNFNDSGVHEFNLACNDKGGYTVTATPYDLKMTGIEDVIAYTDNYTASGANGMWTAAITSGTTGITVTPIVPVGGGVIISSNSNTVAGGTNFTATYRAYVGTEMPAGTYTGTIVYTLIADSTSNGGGSDSGSGGNTGQSNDGGENDSGNDGSENGGDSGINSGNETTNNDGGGSGDSGSNGTPNSTQNITSQTINNNTYNTYGATNTYNTTNYSGSGVSTPIATNTPGATSGSNKDDAESSKSSSSSTGTSDSYEKPLGVKTSTTKSSDEGSGVDLTPIAVAGIALAVAGVAAVALAKNNKEE